MPFNNANHRTGMPFIRINDYLMPRTRTSCIHMRATLAGMRPSGSHKRTMSHVYRTDSDTQCLALGNACFFLPAYRGLGADLRRGFWIYGAFLCDGEVRPSGRSRCATVLHLAREQAIRSVDTVVFGSVCMWRARVHWMRSSRLPCSRLLATLERSPCCSALEQRPPHRI